MPQTLTPAPSSTSTVHSDTIRDAPSPWTPPRLLAAGLLLAAGALVQLDIWRDILRIALRDEESQQVFLVLPVFVWIAWVRRDDLRDIRPRPSLLGPVMIAAGWLTSWYGFNHSMQSAWHGGAVLIGVGCLVSVLGAGLLRAWWPAFLTLVFLVPVPGMIRLQLALPMQKLAASGAQFTADLFALDVYRMGNILVYKDMPIEIAEGCNGMRMMFALILVCYAFAFIQPLRPAVRWLIILLSPLVALLCNIARLLPTVWVYGNYSEPVAKVFHDATGWAMIVASFLLLLGVLSLLRWAHVPVESHEPDDETDARITHGPKTH